MDVELQKALADRFASALISASPVAPERHDEVAETVTFGVRGDTLVCTCGITGSEYTAQWEEDEVAAMRLANEAGATSGELIADTRHYADWKAPPRL